MSRRSWIILGVIGSLALGTEILHRYWIGGRACLTLVNQTTSPMEKVVVTFAGNRLGMGTLGPGGSVNVFLNGWIKGPLSVDYAQKGGSMAGFEIPEFDPEFYRNDQSKLVLTITPSGVERYVEADEVSSTRRTLGTKLSRWIEADLENAQ